MNPREPALADQSIVPVPAVLDPPPLPVLRVGDGWSHEPRQGRAGEPGQVGTVSSIPTPAPPAEAVPPLITGLRIASVSIETQVVEAPLVEQPDGAVTWEVPQFVAGHAESTAGAGAVGNAVLFGHVTSQTLGNVFENLHKVHVGDLVELYSGSATFSYRVADVHTVPRTDSSVVDTANTPRLTLITCTGLWNPLLHDYMERLVVRAERLP